MKAKRILMLGNSFIFVNDLPGILAKLTGAEVVHYTRGGARLAEFLNPNTKMGALTQTALADEKWDYVILQEMSNGPITAKEKFQTNVTELCKRIRANGAKPLLYATWAYQKDGKHLQDFGMDYDDMYQQMYDSYHEAAQANDCLIADVGEMFYQMTDVVNLFAEDGCHPNESGTKLAAEVIAATIASDEFEFRTILPEEAERAVEIEQICFPPHEACSRKSMLERIEAAADLFLVAIHKESGQMAGFLNGVATDEGAFRDEFFTDASLHSEGGANVMLLGLDVMPDYRHMGLAHQIMNQYFQREEERGRKALYLTCLEEKVSFYESMGYIDNGIANSTWGQEEWHEMMYKLGKNE